MLTLTCVRVGSYGHSVDGMVKVRNLKMRMERFNEVVGALKEGKQEMAQQVQELGASIDTFMANIKVRRALLGTDL